MHRTRLIVFTRPIGDPRAKSRLAGVIGTSAVGALHAALVRRAVRAAYECGIAEVELCLAVDTADREEVVERMKQALPCRAAYSIQQGADLGVRMFNAAVHALDTHDEVVIMGTDCAVLEADHIRSAVAALSNMTHAAFIPAEDGGYVLIALNQCDRRLFENIEWGTANVMEQSRAALRRLGWQWKELPVLWDIDTPDDYQRLFRDGLMEALLAA